MDLRLVLIMLQRLLRKPQPSIPDGQRIYAVGDVHGRLDLLEHLLNMLERDNAGLDVADVRLIFLGDLVDRGPDSRGVVARVQNGVSWAKTVALMGNHESVMIDVLDGHTDKLAQWIRLGGGATLISWGISPDLLGSGTLGQILDEAFRAISPQERYWLRKLRTSFRAGDYYFVHAGIRPGISLENQHDSDRLWIRDEFLKSRRKHGAVIVHGHSVHEYVDEHPNRIGLDTGAYKTGNLTAIGLERDKRWMISTAH